MTAPRKMVRKTVTSAKKAADDGIQEIYFQHADGTVDKEDGPDVVGGVVYLKSPNAAPVHFTRNRSTRQD